MRGQARRRAEGCGPPEAVRSRPPTGIRPTGITVIGICRVAGGRITKHWGVPDRFALLARTGALDQLTAADARDRAGPSSGPPVPRRTGAVRLGAGYAPQLTSSGAK